MNKSSKNIMGLGLIAVTAILACVLASSAGESAVRLVGKAAWYLPYVSLVGAVRCLVPVTGGRDFCPVDLI